MAMSWKGAIAPPTLRGRPSHSDPRSQNVCKAKSPSAAIAQSPSSKAIAPLTQTHALLRRYRKGRGTSAKQNRPQQL
ncbi:MAG: hypothetical protein LH660_13300 [Phormidesmis sp. CAN_BIN36]|nr:hypothetical protein [Phormidesmis sp. CAN_BIN36]